MLAWGNSIGDLSTNMAMARKGLANMAITACFAGPVFNMLVGLGAGFALLLSDDAAAAGDDGGGVAHALLLALGAPTRSHALGARRI